LFSSFITPKILQKDPKKASNFAGLEMAFPKIPIMVIIIIIINLHLYSAIPTKKFKSALQEWNGKNKIMYSLCYKFKIM
jgi:hypothetical protein